MKYLKEALWITLIGQGIVWMIVFLSSLLPSFFVGALLGLVGFIIGAVFYFFFSLLKDAVI